MNDTFQIGELIILQHSSAHPEYNGWLAEVVAGGCYRWVVDTRTME